MKTKFAAILLGVSLALAAPAVAKPNEQLVLSVQHRMDILGFSNVDVGELTTAQVAALHMRLQGNYAFGPKRIRTQQEVKAILRWEEK